jgi:hypothetical protein
MTRRIDIIGWMADDMSLNLANYAMAQDEESSIEAVRRSIERTTKLTCCDGPHFQCYEIYKENPISAIWEMTLGTPKSDGGYDVVTQILVQLPLTLEDVIDF